MHLEESATPAAILVLKPTIVLKISSMYAYVLVLVIISPLVVKAQ